MTSTHAMSARPLGSLLQRDGKRLVGPARTRQETREIPVVLVTGRDQDADRRAFADLGVAGVITKPFDAGALGGQLRDLLRWGR
jgi:DNA-binding response OmpR family regulator